MIDSKFRYVVIAGTIVATLAHGPASDHAHPEQPNQQPRVVTVTTSVSSYSGPFWEGRVF